MSKKIKAAHDAPAERSAHDDHRPDVGLYIKVFAALMVLTLVTVAVSKLHLPRPQAIALGLAVALVKASLVGGIFMHLWGEKKLIHKFLYVTGAFAFLFVITMTDGALLVKKMTQRMPVADQHPDEGGEKVSVSEAVALPPPAAPAPKTAKKGKAK